jgi:molybdenum cofactor biosynthesis protein B
VPIVAAVLTASDTRGPHDDESGALVARRLEAHGVRVSDRRVVKDERLALETALRAALAAGADVVVVTGGTGLSPRDVTPEAVRAVCDRELPGFGELFRVLSYEEIGSAAALSRALAASAGRSIVYALPGSPAACRLALERLILPELDHVLTLLGRVAPSRSGRRTAPSRTRRP